MVRTAPNPTHDAANTLPTRHTQEDCESAFKPAAEQECGHPDIPAVRAVHAGADQRGRDQVEAIRRARNFGAQCEEGQRGYVEEVQGMSEMRGSVYDAGLNKLGEWRFCGA